MNADGAAVRRDREAAADPLVAGRVPVIGRVAGFSVNRYDHVRCDDENTMPAGVQSTGWDLRRTHRSGLARPARPGDTVAMTLFWKK